MSQTSQVSQDTLFTDWRDAPVNEMRVPQRAQYLEAVQAAVLPGMTGIEVTQLLGVPSGCFAQGITYDAAPGASGVAWEWDILVVGLDAEARVTGVEVISSEVFTSDRLGGKNKDHPLCLTR